MRRPYKQPVLRRMYRGIRGLLCLGMVRGVYHLPSSHHTPVAGCLGDLGRRSQLSAPRCSALCFPHSSSLQPTPSNGAVVGRSSLRCHRADRIIAGEGVNERALKSDEGMTAGYSPAARVGAGGRQVTGGGRWMMRCEVAGSHYRSKSYLISPVLFTTVV